MANDTPDNMFANRKVPEHPERDYLLNDAEVPLPTRGPRVTVGFWSATQEEYDGDGPPCNGEPLFTIVYPVRADGSCYPWKHVTEDPDDPVHPNSATNTRWSEGRFKFTQFVTLCCSNEGTRAPEEGVEKTLSWSRSQDNPPELFARIVGMDEIHVDQLREDAVVTMRAADGRFLTLDLNNPNLPMRCIRTRSGPECELKAKFPDFQPDLHGGSGDEGRFALMASNGYYLTRSTDSEGRARLYAKGLSIEDACLFTLDIEDLGVAVLRSADDGGYLTHPAPGTELELSPERDPRFGRFTIAYRKA